MRRTILCGLAAVFVAALAAGQTPAASPTPPPAAPSSAVPPAPAPPVRTPSPSSTPAPAVRVAPPAAPTEPSEKIVGIRVLGYQTVAPDTIAHYLGIRVGDPYDPEKIRSNFQALWDVGLLENVSIEAERGTDGVTLVVTIEERPTIKDVEFSGNKKVSTTQIRDKLREAKVEVKVGGPLSLRDIARARSAVSDIYAENGYRGATVEYRIDDVSKTEKKVVFVIDEGDKIKIASIKFEGNTVYSDMRLRAAMKKTKVNTWFRLLSEASTTYSPASYEADVENLKAVYHAKGYKDVVVKDPVLDIYVKNPKAKVKKQKRRVRITIPIVEGDQFFVNEFHIVKVNGNGQPEEAEEALVIPRDRLLKEFRELPPGAVLNRDYLIEALSRVESMYKSKGYIYWFGDPAYREVGNHRVDIDLRLFEGDKWYLGRLEIQGNTNTRDKVVRREFALDEGDIMNMEAVKKSLQKLQQLGYFRIGEEPDFSVRPQDKKVDLTLKGTETSRNEVQFGAGYSALDGFFGQFSFQTRNFLGRGEVLGASAQVGKISNYYDLSYTVPWFLDRNQTIGASVFKRDITYINIDERRTGGTAFYGKGLGLFDSWSVLYQYEDVKSNFPVGGAPVPPGQPTPPTKFTSVFGKTSSFTPGYRFDSRNDPFDPNAGHRLYLTTQVAGSFLGGNTDFIKPLAGGSIYIPVRFPRHSYLAINGEAGYVHPYSSQGVPIYERFQLGGEQSLRGFKAGSIIPLDKDQRVFTDQDGHILGGNKYFVLNAEYVFANIGPAKLLAFGDIGNTFHESQNFSLTGVRSSVGIEMRIFLPIFQAPLRFIYSFNLSPKSPIDQFGFPINAYKDRKRGFDFSIGRTF
ncbi:MAG: outer membrane protein assembly factor BamA [Acidobacteriota bacterium]